jgi:CheY-like chemotaxis protein
LIIAVTGHCEKQYIKKALDSGMNQVLSKPIKGKVL